MVAALTVSAKNAHPYLIALATALVTWTGMSLYLGLFASPAGTRACTVGNCGNPAVFSSLLTLYLIVGIVLVACGSLATSLMLRYYRQHRRS